MQVTHQYKPIRFFILTFLGTWTFWFLAAYFSYQPGMEKLQLLFLLPGLCMPFIAALIMIYGSNNRNLIKDFWERLRINKLKLKFLPIIFLLMPVVLFLATTLSLLFNYSTEQFSLAQAYNVLQGENILGIFIIFLAAPILEELGWRGYGVDSLRSYFNLFITSLIFAFLWGIWHLPLFFIKGYYQHELWNISFIYVLNFFMSSLPAAILVNWIYYKNNRSIIAAILFHSMLNLFSVLFQTEQFTKCIITLLLLVVSTFIIRNDKEFFFNKNKKWMAS